MALGRSRNNKRQSYTSYTSTITTIVFMALCVLGVWMLTSDSVIPQTTKHTTISTTTTTTKTSSNNKNNNDDLTSLNEPQITKKNDKKDDSSFQDNPGELPDDAIKSEDSHQSERGNKNLDHRNNGQDNKSGDSLDKSGNEQESIEENGKQKEEGNESESNQISEESSMTKKEHANGESDENISFETRENKESNDDQQQQQQQHEEQQLEDRQEEHKKQRKEDEVDQNNENEITKDQQGEQKKQRKEDEIDQSNVSETIKEEQKRQRKEDEVDQSNESETVKDQQEAQRKQRKDDEAGQSNESETTKDDQLEQIKQRKEDEADHSNESETVNNQDKQQQQETQEKAQSYGDESNGQSSQDESKTHEKNLEEPRNEISEEDRQKRIEEQHKQRIEDQEKDIRNSNSNAQQKLVQQESKEDNYRQEENETSKVLPALSNNQNQEQQKKNDSSEGYEKSSEFKSDESFHGGNNSEISKESNESKKSWKTQNSQSENQKERRQNDLDNNENINGHNWQLCNVTAGTDYIPCLDNEKALRQLHSTGHFEHRERHCPEEPPTCLIPLPEGYKRPIEWPKSRDKIWYHNVPHTLLANVKGHQNWVKVTGEFLTFPGGGTQFIHGALHYIDFLQKSVPNIKWGKHTRVVLDVGCGVASFGGYLFERDVLTMSFAPKDEHKAQVQFALERGIPAISAVMGSKRLPFPSMVFDAVHCARCRVPWHREGGSLLLELNRVLKPGGIFIWSATPVYQKLQEDVEIWNAMTELTASLCWELVTIQRDKLNHVGVAIYRKPRSNDCYDQRKKKHPPMCKNGDDPNAAWYVPLQPCMHRNPSDESERGTRWPVVWPRRLRLPPYWLNNTQMGIYGKPAPQDFAADYDHWKHVVSSLYMSGLGISWSGVRNVMDMRAAYGGFAAALKDLKMWVMNVVNVDSPDTLPIIYERGLFGLYHDWCESFSTYPRTYDLLHADHLFSKLKKRCNLVPVVAEVDRIVRPGGKIIVRDEASAIGEVENLLKSLHWEVFSKNQNGILSAQKGYWRPKTYVASS